MTIDEKDESSANNSPEIPNAIVGKTGKGQTIGKYEIQGLLGRGSTGLVYLGYDPQLQRQVAVKVLQIARAGHRDPDSELQTRSQLVKRFLAEAQSAGRLHHPNIISLFEGDVHGPSPFLVMEYVGGKTLDSLIKSGHRFRNEEVLALLRQLAGAIDYAHAQGVLHRDIKPGNIIIDKDRKPYILDFGVAKIHEQISSEDEGVRPTAVLGTPAYMSPEQICNQPLNSKSDLFAFAIVAFQCFGVVRPFEGDTFTAVASSILEKAPKLLTSLRPDLSPAVDQVFVKALAKDRNERFETAQAFYESLNEALHLVPESKLQSTEISLSQTHAEPNLAVERITAKRNLLGPRQGERSVIDKVLPKIPSQRRGSKNSSLPIFIILTIGSLVLLSSTIYLFWPRRTVVVIAGQESIDSKTMGVTESLPSSQISESQALEAKANSDLIQNLFANANSPEVLDPLLLELNAKAKEDPKFKVDGLLRHPNFLVKIGVIKILIERSDTSAVPAIVDLLTDEDPLVRGFSAKALGVLADAKVGATLAKRASEERIPEVLRAIENAMERISKRS